MDLHMRRFDGITFGMESQNAAGLRALKKKVFFAEVTPRGYSHPVKRLCVPAKAVAAVMGQCAWLVSELRVMETLRFGDSPEYYIVYEEAGS